MPHTIRVQLPPSSLDKIFPEASGKPHAVELCMMHSVSCEYDGEDRTSVNLTFTSHHLKALQGYLAGYHARHRPVCTRYAPLEDAACALNAIHDNVFYVLLRHTPGKNMRIATVGIHLANDMSLAVVCTWNGYVCEVHGAVKVAQRYPAVEPLARLIDARCRRGFWTEGAGINNEMRRGSPKESDNMWTYCTLLPFLYCTIGFAQRLLGTHKAPPSIARVIFHLAANIASAHFVLETRMVLTLSAGHNASLNAAHPTECASDEGATLFKHLCAMDPGGREAGMKCVCAEDAMRCMDRLLALANKVVIDAFGRGKVYRGDNYGEDMSLVCSQWAHGGDGDEELWAKRDCEDCAQVFVQLCNSMSSFLTKYLARLCAHLTAHIDLVRVTYEQDKKDMQHTLTAVLYTSRAPGREFCEIHLCENTCRQYIETAPRRDPLMEYVFSGGGGVRDADEACEHYRCLQWFGGYMLFVAYQGPQWCFGAKPYTRYPGAPRIVRTLDDAASPHIGLVLLDPLLYLSQRAALFPLIPNHDHTWEHIPDAWAQAAAMADLAEQLYPKIHHMYNENTGTTCRSADKVVAALRERVARELGAGSPWLAVLDGSAEPAPPVPMREHAMQIFYGPKSHACGSSL